ncbi:MAG: hypothetical protein GF334_01420 [Candidatus Altiarchaeales archaeon]|nr:hypothetical protein [Candidatus Altiarchaeales archaeon]
MARLNHEGGLPELVSEIGFSSVKYFETSVGSTPYTLSIDPPAKRIILRNTSSSDDVFLRLDGEEASNNVGALPGDNIKISPQAVFSIDYDTISTLSVVASGTASVEGILGFKG